MASTTEPPATTTTSSTELEETPPRKDSIDPVPVSPSSSSSQVKSPKFEFSSFSQLLEGVVRAANSAASHPTNPLVVENVKLEVQFKMSHQEALASVTAKATEPQVQPPEQQQLPTEPASSSNTSPTTRTEPMLLPNTQSTPSSSTPENKADSTCQDQKSSTTSFSLEKKSLSLPEKNINNAYEPVCDTPRAPHSDGYSWRKYGQKQVRCPESSRSYYRCTHAGCNVKKTVQHCDKSGQIITVEYKSEHNHDPPPPHSQRSHYKCNSLKKQTAPLESVAKTSGVDVSSQQKRDDVSKSSPDNEYERAMVLFNESDKNNLDKPRQTKSEVAAEEPKKTVDEVKRPEAMQPVVVHDVEPCNSSDQLMTDVAKDRNVITGQKRRMTEKSKECPMTPQKSFKDPKIVVHSAGDAAISNDGYRWRKYGQKMVKGNPHPRSYYRCTSAGCPVRKHVERAIDNSEAIVVTYEGEHDHDSPVPKKRMCYSSSAASTSTPISAIPADNAPSCQMVTQPSQSIPVSAIPADNAPSCQMVTQPSQVTLIEPKQEKNSEDAPDEKNSENASEENREVASDEKKNKNSPDEKKNKNSSDKKNNSENASDEKNRKIASDEKKNKNASDEKNRKIASDEKKNKNSSDEKNRKIVSDEKKNKDSPYEKNNSENASDEKKRKIASDEKKNKNSSDEKNRKIASDEKKNKNSSDEKNRKIASDEKKNKNSPDEKKNKNSSDEKNNSENASDVKNRKIASDEKKNKNSSDEKNRKIASDEKQNKNSSDEKNNGENTSDENRKIASDEKKNKNSTDEKNSENASDEKKSSELGTENKMLESAQTLLSIEMALKSTPTTKGEFFSSSKQKQSTCLRSEKNGAGVSSKEIAPLSPPTGWNKIEQKESESFVLAKQGETTRGLKNEVVLGNLGNEPSPMEASESDTEEDVCVGGWISRL